MATRAMTRAIENRCAHAGDDEDRGGCETCLAMLASSLAADPFRGLPFHCTFHCHATATATAAVPPASQPAARVFQRGSGLVRMVERAYAYTLAQFRTSQSKKIHTLIVVDQTTLPLPSSHHTKRACAALHSFSLPACLVVEQSQPNFDPRT